MTAASADVAVAEAKAQTRCVPGLCLQIVRGWLEIPAYYPSAIAAWNGAQLRHDGRQPPRGAPVYYAGGAYGHVALSLGGGWIRSTDAPSRGVVSSQRLDWPELAWGFRYLGSSDDLNRVTIPWLVDDPEDDPMAGGTYVSLNDPEPRAFTAKSSGYVKWNVEAADVPGWHFDDGGSSIRPDVSQSVMVSADVELSGAALVELVVVDDRENGLISTLARAMSFGPGPVNVAGNGTCAAGRRLRVKITSSAAVELKGPGRFRVRAWAR